MGLRFHRHIHETWQHVHPSSPPKIASALMYPLHSRDRHGCNVEPLPRSSKPRIHGLHLANAFIVNFIECELLGMRTITTHHNPVTVF